MKTVIVYASVHHGNTRQVLDAIAAEHAVDLIDAVKVKTADLSDYDLIGFASGIFYSNFHKAVREFAERNTPHGKRVFLLYTCGAPRHSYTAGLHKILSGKQAEFAGTFHCLGFDTFGPFKLIGGVAKGHPDAAELKAAAAFYERILTDGAEASVRKRRKEHGKDICS